MPVTSCIKDTCFNLSLISEGRQNYSTLWLAQQRNYDSQETCYYIYKSLRKFMVKFLRTSENCGIKGLTFIDITYPEWPHRQCIGLAFRSRTFAADSVQQVMWFAARIAVCNTWSSGGIALCRVGGATSQLDLPSLTPLSIAGCGWLQLGAPHWATSVITASSW